MLVLPPIVYVAAFFTPIRSFRANLGNIVSLAIGLVLASTFAVAAVAMAIVPGITLPIAIALGAIVSPPDEVAALAVVERLAVPRRLVTLLQGENLLNDATALTIYRVALVTAAVGTPILAWAPVGRFVLVALGGIAIGLVIGWLSAYVRSRITDTPVEITVSLLTPYAAYLPADMHLADLPSYLEADARLTALYADQDAWARKAILNVASSGKFSSDRTIAQYAADIWHAKPCPVV